MSRSVLVIGGGLIGVASAWFLRARGFAVSVVDRCEGCALETSFANGGLLTPSQADPWNAPGVFLQLLRWLGREDSPLLLRPRAMPGVLRWGMRFLLASRPAAHRRATETNLRLGLYSVRVQQALRSQLGLQYDSRSLGTIKIFRRPADFQAALALAESLAPLGLQYRRLAPEEAAAMEPTLAPVARRFVGAIHYPGDESGDAHQFTRALAEHAARAGVQFLFSTVVRGFRASAGRIVALDTSAGALQADSYVLAAGSYSSLLAKPLGLYLPIYPAKGYSLTINFAPATSPLGVPLVDFEQKIVMTPLGTRLRVAGTAEFAGYDTGYNAARGASLLRQARALIPAIEEPVEQGRVSYWAGLRPMTCDGPPIIGPSPYANLYFNTGHGPLGWTLAAGSAALLADIIAGRTPAIALAGLDYARFAR